MTVEWLVLVFGLILTVLSIFEKYIMIKGRGKQPFLEHEARIATLEAEVKEIKDDAGDDRESIRKLEDNNHVTMQALFALLGHSIDGNNSEELHEARKELNRYLSRK